MLKPFQQFSGLLFLTKTKYVVLMYYLYYFLFLLCLVFVNRSFEADPSPACTGVKRYRQRAPRRWGAGEWMRRSESCRTQQSSSESEKDPRLLLAGPLDGAASTASVWVHQRPLVDPVQSTHCPSDRCACGEAPPPTAKGTWSRNSGRSLCAIRASCTLTEFVLFTRGLQSMVEVWLKTLE